MGGGSLQMITVLHRGGSSQMITILHRGGPPKWLQYYIGVVWQMITVYHESWVVTLGILFPKTWQKNIFFSVGKKSFLGGMSKWLQLYIGGYSQMITVLHGAGMPKWLQYYMGGGGSRDPQKWLRNMCTTPKGKCAPPIFKRRSHC